MILVDTSVWVEHLRQGENALVKLLEQNEVLMHPLVVGEIACGNLRHRNAVLSLMDNLPAATQASNEEARLLIEQAGLMGSGLGFIDVHLLASARLTPETMLWTHDRRLRAAAATLSLS